MRRLEQENRGMHFLGVPLHEAIKIQGRPAVLIQHVLTVLVFLSWVLVLPGPSSFVSEPQIVPLG